jgi:L-glyceraldehyde 3-phosphate reductase
VEYTRLGRTGLKVSRIALGCMSFGDTSRGFNEWALDEDAAGPLFRQAVELGITFWDTANVYGYGSSEEIVGRAIKKYTRREDVVLATKVFFKMHDGPGGSGLSRRAIMEQIDASLARLGTDYVDLYQIHRFDPDTPVEETMMALDHAVRQGKALYAGISSYSAAKTHEAASIARELGTPLLIHQPSYSLLNRWIEEDLLDELEEQGMGVIVFSALAQGLLTDRYLDGIPPDSRAAREGSTIPGDHLGEQTLRHVRRLNEIAEGRGQKLAQMALQWALRDPRVTSAVIGASSVEQLDTNIDALSGPAFTPEELKAIDDDAVDAGINLWAKQTQD